MSGHYLTANEAAEALGVTRATLYAYASRGQIRSSKNPGQPRESRYLREDIELLKDRTRGRRDPAAVSSRGLHWGSAVLESRITLIRDGTLYYRGLAADELARTASLEQTAVLLWGNEPVEWARAASAGRRLAEKVRPHLRPWKTDPIAALQIALPSAAALDAHGHDFRPPAARQTGARILSLLTSIAIGRAAAGDLHEALHAAWAPASQTARDAIRAALVLCADHELNVSSFTARCAASAGAGLYDVVSAALATLKGREHGGAAARVAALLREAAPPARPRGVIAARLRRGDPVSGFGHPLYPAGDPRARMLLEIAASGGLPGEVHLIGGVQRAAFSLLGDHPNLDFALSSLARAFHLPEHAPFLLFALGRTAGWIAHAMEQYAGGELIRPRARYVGPDPRTTDIIVRR